MDEFKRGILSYESRRHGSQILWLRWDWWDHGFPAPEFGPRNGTTQLVARNEHDQTPMYRGEKHMDCTFCGTGGEHTEAMHAYQVELWRRGRTLVVGQEIVLRSGKMVTVAGTAFDDGWYPSIWTLSDGKRIKVSLFDVPDIADVA